MKRLTHIPFTDIHTHRRDAPYPSLLSVRLGKDNILPDRSFSAGVHPWDTDDMPDSVLCGIENKFLAAIGEIGLDFAASSSRDKQYKWFRRQLGLASLLQLPVILHCVKAYNEVLNELSDFDLPAIFHGFTGPPELARQILKDGHYLSFGRSIFNSQKTAEALKIIPAEMLFIETDDSLIPIEDIYAKASEIRSCSIESLKIHTYNNFQGLFPATDE